MANKIFGNYVGNIDEMHRDSAIIVSISGDEQIHLSWYVYVYSGVHQYSWDY